MNALLLLKADHRAVEALFKRFERLSDDANAEKRAIVQKIIRELSIHASIEEQLLYPAARAIGDQLNEDVLVLLEEHHVAKWTLDELDGLPPTAERFNAKVTVLMAEIRLHIDEEESVLFPELRRLMGRDQLNALGAALKQAKALAPTHPHPMAPDEPPANFVAGGLAKVLDTSRDVARGVRRRAVSLAARTARTARGRSNKRR